MMRKDKDYIQEDEIYRMLQENGRVPKVPDCNHTARTVTIFATVMFIILLAFFSALCFGCKTIAPPEQNEGIELGQPYWTDGWPATDWPEACHERK